jgi:hypothetical protein
MINILELLGGVALMAFLWSLFPPFYVGWRLTWWWVRRRHPEIYSVALNWREFRDYVKR